MEAKIIEVIMRIDFASSTGTEIVAHAERVSELVRCKDCKHKPIDTVGKGYGEDLSFDDDYKCPCKCEDPFYSWMPEDDWFCANGERSK